MLQQVGHRYVLRCLHVFSPYSTEQFPKYAEEIPPTAAELNIDSHPSTFMLHDEAKRSGIYLIGGSIPERDADGRVYNTSVVFDPTGDIVAKHRKVHLFDIDIPGRMTFKESDTLSAGSSLTTVDTPYGKIGIGICYDIRFPQLALLYREVGCKLLIYPGAFNMTTGPIHWELLQRARAVDCQVSHSSIAELGLPTWCITVFCRDCITCTQPRVYISGMGTFHDCGSLG